MSSEVTAYIEKKESWSKELSKLRELLVQLPVQETIKWGAPTYTYNEKNVVGMAAFKNYFGLWFFQGALLKDKAKVLWNAQEGKTKAMLQWRFSDISEIDEDLIKSYVLEAIENVKLGKAIKPKRSTKLLTIAKELENAFEEKIELKEAFYKLTISRQREFSNYIIEAKRDATKLKRKEKIIPMILRGEGLYDKYKNC